LYTKKVTLQEFRTSTHTRTHAHTHTRTHAHTHTHTHTHTHISYYISYYIIYMITIPKCLQYKNKCMQATKNSNFNYMCILGY